MCRKSKANSTKVKLLNESVPENKEQLLSDWCKYFINLLNNESSSNETNYPDPSDYILSISFEEVEEAVRTFKNDKAPGYDYAVTAEILKEIVVDYVNKKSEVGFGYLTNKGKQHENIRKLRNSSTQIERKISDFDFADDIALLESDRNKAQEQLNSYSENAKKVELLINAEKTVSMVFNIQQRPYLS
ncbi:unnamed protein product [Brachionus calyciflorus]|uniref:Uncharacterized protein n=1 Tax=Brachionus calyciflorus TaxID=104777 RepID=A0A814BPK7_9BILA|nr:unnamed protein product [Brachionus calyciflorus]